MAKEKAIKKTRQSERSKNPRPDPVAYEVTLDTVEKEKLPRVTLKNKSKADKAYQEDEGETDVEEKEDAAPVPDPIKSESLNILNDLANQMQGTRTAGIMDRE